MATADATTFPAPFTAARVGSEVNAIRVPAGGGDGTPVLFVVDEDRAALEALAADLGRPHSGHAASGFLHAASRGAGK
jgi:hypothetical protein